MKWLKKAANIAKAVSKNPIAQQVGQIAAQQAMSRLTGTGWMKRGLSMASAVAKNPIAQQVGKMAAQQAMARISGTGRRKKFKKGSQAAKDHMSMLRAMRR